MPNLENVLQRNVSERIIIPFQFDCPLFMLLNCRCVFDNVGLFYFRDAPIVYCGQSKAISLFLTVYYSKNIFFSHFVARHKDSMPIILSKYKFIVSLSIIDKILNNNLGHNHRYHCISKISNRKYMNVQIFTVS